MCIKIFDLSYAKQKFVTHLLLISSFCFHHLRFFIENMLILVKKNKNYNLKFNN